MGIFKEVHQRQRNYRALSNITGKFLSPNSIRVIPWVGDPEQALKVCTLGFSHRVGYRAAFGYTLFSGNAKDQWCLVSHFPLQYISCSSQVSPLSGSGFSNANYDEKRGRKWLFSILLFVWKCNWSYVIKNMCIPCKSSISKPTSHHLDRTLDHHQANA